MDVLLLLGSRLFAVQPAKDAHPQIDESYLMNNFEKYFGSPAKLAACIIEHDIEEEDVRGIDEYLCVSCFFEGRYIDLGEFAGSWEFEEWLCSDLPFSEWRNQRSNLGSDSL